jgi:dTDP-4-dehydrorhamnose reductase
VCSPVATKLCQTQQFLNSFLFLFWGVRGCRSTSHPKRKVAQQLRILLISPTGQIGWELQRTLAPLGQVVAAGRASPDHFLNLEDPDSIRKTVNAVMPNLIVNAAAYTAVDRAEDEVEKARTVNGIAPGILADAAKRVGAGLVHYSTDYVFSGDKITPYTEADEPGPRNVYGKTKLEGEQAIQAIGIAHLILRTSWVYGIRGRNFLLSMLRLFRERDEVKVVDDQRGGPTWSRMIAEATAQLLIRTQGDLRQSAELYHLSSTGETSWHGFATKILEFAVHCRAIREGACLVKPISTRDYPITTPRPAYTVLANDKLAADFGLRLPAWENQLALCMADLHPG